jgi:hypothetical protein
MLRTTLRKLVRGCGVTPRRSPRASTRQPSLEALEDRLVLSTATSFGSTLGIIASPGSANHVRPILLEADPKDHSLLNVLDTGQLLGQFKIASITAVDVVVQGDDAITVDDSNGFPFAAKTTISLFGTGVNNSLILRGSQAINASEAFTAGTATQAGSLVLGGSAFVFSGAIASVADEVPDTTTTLFVDTSAQAVTLTSRNGHTAQFSGLASGGGGNTLTFLDKTSVALELLGPNATATLDAPAAPRGLKTLQARLFGNSDTLDIKATPSRVETFAFANGLLDTVLLRGNSGRVIIQGASPSLVILGTDADPSKSVTAGIKADVSVSGAGLLEILDEGNVKTREQVTVTESTVTGKGLFGNDGVVLTYSAPLLGIGTGRLANTYTVAPSHPGARFSGTIGIADDSSDAGLSVHVSVDPGSGLHLDLSNKDPKTGSLAISAAPGAFHTHATFNPQVPTTPNGTEAVQYLGRPVAPIGKIGVGLTSVVTYTGFDSVADEES